MTTATPGSSVQRGFVEPRVHRWTRQEYYRMADAGLFNSKRVELIGGQIFEMSAMNSPHATAVTLTLDALREVFKTGWVVRTQMPLDIDEDSLPEPDVAVVRGKARDYKAVHPRTSALVVEVADSSLDYDQNYKASLYARAGIADYWIVNLAERRLEVYRKPVKDKTSDFGFSYADVKYFRRGDSVRPLAKPRAVIAVADLLP